MIPAIAIILAVTSPLSSGSDYHFTYIPNAGYVRGTVAGEDGCGAIRKEDWLFLNEAFEERRLYVSAATTSAWQSAIAAASVATNASMKIEEPKSLTDTDSHWDWKSAMIPPDAELSTAARLIYRTDGEGGSVTNIGTSYLTTNEWFGLNWDEWQCFQITNTISQTMTNGVADIYTNVFPTGSGGTSNEWQFAEFTNQLNHLDFIFSDRRPKWEEFLPSNRYARGSIRGTEKRSPWLTRSDIRDAYELVRELRMAVATVTAHYPTNASGQNAANGHYYSHSVDDERVTETNQSKCVTYLSLNQSESNFRYESTRSWLSGGEWQSTNTVTVATSSQIEQCDGNVFLKFEMPEAVDTMFCEDGRFSEAWGFCRADISKRRSVSTYRTVADDRGGVTENSNLTWSAEVMVPLGRMSETRESERIILESATSSATAIAAAITASGIEPIVYRTLPQLPSMPTAEVREIDGYRTSVATASSFESITVSPQEFYIVYTFKPLTVLSDWSEYDEDNQ